MKKEELAEMINGREYTEEINQEIRKAMEGTGLVVVFGASDDLMEFRGAIYDESDCYDGGIVHLTKSGLLQNECEDYDCPYFEKSKASTITIEALWCKEDNISWTYKTDIPHSTFEILEDDEVYCRGIVFNLSDVETTDK